MPQFPSLTDNLKYLDASASDYITLSPDTERDCVCECAMEWWSIAGSTMSDAVRSIGVTEVDATLITPYTYHHFV